MKTAETEPIAPRRQTIQLCSLYVDNRLYGIDTRAIREVLAKASPQPVPLAPEYIAGALTYRGEVLEAVSLRRLLGIGEHGRTDRLLVLEDRDGGERFGLAVDSVGDMVVATEDALEHAPATLEDRGGTVLSGIYRTDTALMARLDPGRLRPTELARNAVLCASRTESRGTR